MNDMLNINQFDKIEDIIFIDEPILTHYKRNNKDFLLYLVDSLETNDHYLLFEVEEEIVFKYITKRISLREIITTNKNIFFQLYQDFTGITTKVEIIEPSSINNDLLPLEDSFLSYSPLPESHYSKLIEDYESRYYLMQLREDAFYLKLSPNNRKYSSTIGFNELASKLLLNISKSYKSFLKADYIASFTNANADETALLKTFNKLLPDLDLRMVDARYGSFEIGLAIDKTVKEEIENKEIKKWAIEIGTKYKDVVLEQNYSIEQVDEIVEQYSVEDRKKIFQPLFDITEKSEFTLNIKENKGSSYNKVQIKDKSMINKIIPPTTYTLEIEDNRDLEIVQVTTVIDKNKRTKSIKLENSLFNSTDNATITLNKKDFVKYGYSDTTENINIEVLITVLKNSISLSANYESEPFNIVEDSGNIEIAKQRLIARIYEFINLRNL